MHVFLSDQNKITPLISVRTLTMSIRTFIFCDICNPQALRSIEFRRSPREEDRNGRRLSDGRAWLEGSLSNALEQGWITNANRQHICPVCQQNNN